MAEIQGGELKLEPNELYREETITDRKAGSIRRLTPVNEEGHDDSTRPVLYIGQVQLMTPMGTLPLAFELEVGSLKEALEEFPKAAQEAVERTAKELEEMRREAASSIVVPGSGGGGLPGAGGIPGAGGGIQIP